MTPVFELCDAYVVKGAALDPISASVVGIAVDFGAATDYSPDGHAARAELARATLAELADLPGTSRADRLAASHLRERLEAEDAWDASGEPLRMLQAPF